MIKHCTQKLFWAKKFGQPIVLSTCLLLRYIYIAIIAIIDIYFTVLTNTLHLKYN